MSNLWFNIRFGKYHLQIGPNTLSFKLNTYWLDFKPTKWFEVYCYFGIDNGR